MYAKTLATNTLATTYLIVR